MSETPELTVLALTAIQRETFVVLWLFKMCTKVCFFPSVALARSYQDFNELSAKKTCWPSSKRVNWTSILSVIYLSKRFFYHYYEIIIGVYLLGCLWDAKSIWKIRIALMDPCFSIDEALFVVQRTTCAFGNRNENWKLLHGNFAHTPRKEMNSFEFVGCDLSVRKTSTLIFSFQSNCFPKNFWLLQWNICLEGKHSFLLLWSWKRKITNSLSYS